MKRVVLVVLVVSILFGGCRDREEAERLCSVGLSLIRVNSRKDAVDTLRAAIKEDDSYIEAHYYLGFCYGCMGQSKSALKEFDIASNLRPETASDSLYVRAALLAIYNVNRIINDPASKKFDFQDFVQVEAVFENASMEFQFLMARDIMPYSEFLELNLDGQIRKCNELGQRIFGGNSFAWTYAIQEWLSVNARTVRLITEYK